MQYFDEGGLYIKALLKTSKTIAPHGTYTISVRCDQLWTDLSEFHPGEEVEYCFKSQWVIATVVRVLPTSVVVQFAFHGRAFERDEVKSSPSFAKLGTHIKPTSTSMPMKILKSMNSVGALSLDRVLGSHDKDEIVAGLKMGFLVDVKDNQGKWILAEVVRVNSRVGSITVKFSGFSSSEMWRRT